MPWSLGSGGMIADPTLLAAAGAAIRDEVVSFIPDPQDLADTVMGRPAKRPAKWTGDVDDRAGMADGEAAKFLK